METEKWLNKKLVLKHSIMT